MKPVPVRRIRFVDGRQDGPGLSVASACVSVLDGDQGRNSRYRIEYHPWVKAFWIECYAHAGAGGPLLDAEYIPEHRVMTWKPVEPLVAPAPKK